MNKLEEIIKKYNLKKYNEKDDFIGKVYFDLYQNSENKNGIETFYNLDNQMSVDLDNGKTYFLTIETIDHNKLKFNKKFDAYMPTHKTKVYKIELKGEF